MDNAKIVVEKRKKGRPRGALGRMSHEIQDDIFETYKQLGGVEYLSVVATEDPKTFCGLLSKLVPNQIRAELGRPGEFDHLDNKQLDEAILDKLSGNPELGRRFFDRLIGTGIPITGTGLETIVRESDPVHENDSSEL